MTLEERLSKNPPANAKANVKGGDKTKIEADGGLDLSANDIALAKARGGKLNTKPYSDSVIR